MTERTDQFDERDQLEGIEPPVGDEADVTSGDAVADAAAVKDATGGAATSGQGPDAFGAPEGGGDPA
jgi:hypothetical protein